MAELNPLACEFCRSKKSKCDRKIPSCSQCQLALRNCRYLEGGKRGIPAAYMTALEKRLQETEAALYTALNAIEDHGRTIASPAVKWYGTSNSSRSKTERQHEWKQQPLQSKEQLAAWFRGKKSEEQFSEQDDPSVEHPRDDSREATSGIQTCEPALEAPPASPQMCSHYSGGVRDDVFDRMQNMETPHAPNASQEQSAIARQWRNYF
ncbi:hypothetical protein P154DRAFT_65738 [Amniculicola lignicola CBS 123094]|uniref:Zn(2)-C6 fungal-type domain-containing protein n=1 Tax=Amniculicola lignicola CBS 123094 TaxID=1392246 RepID=A0A6A5WSM4_9PLEO|nr:hypothetical protein P154DRAFT_65738 [Amniculicola lignicola CBS 123094]